MGETENKRYFLDLGGLTTLWGKIKASFADKTTTENSINSLNDDVNTLKTDVQTLNNDVGNLELNVLAIAPREVNYYNEAIEASKELAIGTTINIKYSETSAEDPTPSGYFTGVYIVTGVGEIKYLSTSVGDTDASDITALGERVNTLEDTVITSAQIIDENGNQLDQSFSVNDNVLLIAYDDTLDVNTNSVKALTHRAIARKFKDIESSLTQIPKFKVAVVDELPKKDISLTTIYLLRNSKDYTDNLFTEYIYVESIKDDPSTEVDESKFIWEKLGEQTLLVSDIITKDDLDNAINIALSDYAKTADIKLFIQTENNNLKLDILGTVENNYATKSALNDISKNVKDISDNLANYLTIENASTTYLTLTDAENTYLSKTDANNSGWLTEDEVLTSIQYGTIGEEIVITDELIDEMITNSNN